jgi:predicted Zn-dependent protease with MMP-like domain
VIEVTDEQFEDLIQKALDSLPGEHVKNIQNIAIVWQDDPDEQQRQEVMLRDDQTLFGLYQGTPLSRRLGLDKMLPDKITLFKNPLRSSANSLPDLQERIRHTLWHEIGHYYGLDHQRIHELEQP